MELARKFKIIVNSKECGTCSGSSPSAVAKKVVKKLCGTSSKAVRFSLKECKRGCERVCGPYQGRMEKLDRPCKRDGKKITHRVVCGKVRKMRGGRDLVAADFIRPKISDMFHPEMIDGKPHVFFGGKYTDPFRFVVFNRELVKLLGKKSIGIDVLEGNDVKHVDLNVLSLELQYELSRLREFLKDETEYKTIREFLEKYGILQKIKEQTFSNIPADYTTYSKKYDIRYNPHTKLVKTDKYSILFFGFLQSTPSFCLVFTDNAFIIIDFKQTKDKDKDIISIEDLFGSSFHFSDYIYLLATDDNVQGFIKEKLNKLIETEKKIREKIRKYFKHFDLKNIEIQTDDLLHILKKEFPDIHNQNIFYRIIDQEKTFIRKQIEKSKRAHMKNNSNKTIRVVYGNDINNQNNYDRFLKEGKRSAIAEKAETNEKQAQRKAKENEEKAETNEKQAQRNAEKDRRNAEKAQINAEKAQRNAEKAQRNEQMLRNQIEENNFMTSMTSKFNKKKYTQNQKNRNMAKNFIKELYKKDKKFISNLVRWYWSHVVVIYNNISDNFENRSINHRSNDFNGKLREDLTPEKLYESENFPKNNSLNYTYEESQAFARFFIDTLNAHMQSKWIDYYNFMKYDGKSRGSMYDLFKTELEKFMNKVLNEELNIQFTNNRNGNNNNNNNNNGNE